MKRTVIGVFMLLAFSGYAVADSAVDGCKSAIKAFESKDVDGALEEARWCVEALEQEKQSSVATSFSDKVGSFVGEEVEENKAMGMMVTSRRYVDGDKEVTVTLTQSGGGASPMGALGAIANMGMMGAGKKFRMQGHTGTDMSEGSQAKLMITPKSGSGFISFESRDISPTELRAFTEEFLKTFKDS